VIGEVDLVEVKCKGHARLALAVELRMNKCKFDGPHEFETEQIVEHKMLFSGYERSVELRVELQEPNLSGFLADLDGRGLGGALHLTTVTLYIGNVAPK